MDNISNITIVCGPTASGKSNFALEIAQKTNGVIINADAFQVYENLEICTASPSKEDKGIVPHYLYNFVSPTDQYTVGKYVLDANEIIKKVVDTQKHPIIVGGTGLYIYSLLYGLDDIPYINDEVKNEVDELFASLGQEKCYSDLAALIPDLKNHVNPFDHLRTKRVYEVFKMTGKPLWYFYKNTRKGTFLENKANEKLNYMHSDLFDFQNITATEKDVINRRGLLDNISVSSNSSILKDKQSISQDDNNGIITRYHIRLYKILPNRSNLYEVINQRVIHMVNNGAMKEVNMIRDNWKTYSLSAKKTILAQELYEYISGNLTLDVAILGAQKRTRNYAKRQYTWFKNKL